jgi:hypothetical protein
MLKCIYYHLNIVYQVDYKTSTLITILYRDAKNVIFFIS